MKHLTQVTLDVVITYDILSAIQVEDYILPAMIELKQVDAILEKEDGKRARVNLLKVLSEAQRLLLEDEIIEALTENT